jgi:regulator of replication initiation timing
MSSEIEEIRSQIEGLVEKVTDLAMQDLRETIDAGEVKSSSKEKQLMRVRRSLEKASHLLSGLEY